MARTRERRRGGTPWVEYGIAPAARWAALVTAGCLILTGTAYLVASWDELMCRGVAGSCYQIAGIAGMIWFAALAAVGLGIRILWIVPRRAVDERGSTGWTWALAALFILGVAVVAGLLPTWTCPAGAHLDATFGLCITRTVRFDARSWLWLKVLVALGGVAVGTLVVPRPRLIALGAPLAAVAWGSGFGWLLVETVGKHLAG